MQAWKLRYRALGRGPDVASEAIYLSEEDFAAGLQSAYRNFGTDLKATLPDGGKLTEAALRKQYPPE
jgi:hypothetical protein